MGILTVTAKIKLYTDASQNALLYSTMRQYRDACNFVAEYVFRTHDLKQASLNKALYYEIRSRFGLGAQFTQSVLKTVIARYKTILENEKTWVRPDFKKPQLDLVWNRDYSLTKSKFSVNTLQGRLKLDYCSIGMEPYFDSSVYSFGTAKLVLKHQKYYLHIPVSYEVPDVDLSDTCNIVGIDRGINFIVATYDSKGVFGFISGRSIKQRRGHYRQVRLELQRRQTPSARRRLKAIGNRENRWIQDVNHCVSKALVTQYPEYTLFVLEDLTDIHKKYMVKLKSKRARQNRNMLVSWAFYDLEQKLKYKAIQHGQMVINVNPAYTSQMCPKCGHTEQANRNKRDHVFCCKNCGYQSNDDRIGAMNLYRKGIECISSNVVPDTVTCE